MSFDVYIHKPEFYVPPYVVGNSNVAELFTSEFITQKEILDKCKNNWFKLRHRVDKEENSATMALEAANALKSANFWKFHNDIWAIVVSTMNPARYFPNTASLIAHQLWLSPHICFDLNNACPWGITAATMIAALIQNGQVNNGIVISTEAMSLMLKWTDYNAGILFGDWAAAIWFSNT